MRSRLCRHRSLSDRKSTRLNSSHSLHDALPIYQIRGTVILLQNIAIDDLRGFFQTELADALQALPAQIFVQLHADGVRVELLGCRDDDASVAAAQIEHLFAWFEPAQFQHLQKNAIEKRDLK